MGTAVNNLCIRCKIVRSPIGMYTVHDPDSEKLRLNGRVFNFQADPMMQECRSEVSSLSLGVHADHFVWKEDLKAGH